MNGNIVQNTGKQRSENSSAQPLFQTPKHSSVVHVKDRLPMNVVATYPLKEDADWITATHSTDMPQRRPLTNHDRSRAIAWLQNGDSIRSVARRLQKSPSVIHRLRERFHTTGGVQDRPRSGRPRVTTRAEDRYVVLHALRNRFTTASALRLQLRHATNTNVSISTIKNRLRAANLWSRRPAVRPPLRPQHRAARLAWCRAHVIWNNQQWSRVLCTDESRFCLEHNDGRIRVLRRRGERFHDATVREKNRFGGGSVIVWGGFSLHHRTPLYHIKGNLTGLRYRDEILRPLVLPALNTIGAGAHLQDDNARPHRARVVRDFLQQNQVNVMPWPAYSPDLAPIEHVWDILGRRVRDNHGRAPTLQILVQWLQMEWQAIPQATLRTLVRSMRRRCTECIRQRGGHTHY